MNDIAKEFEQEIMRKFHKYLNELEELFKPFESYENMKEAKQKYKELKKDMKEELAKYHKFESSKNIPLFLRCYIDTLTYALAKGMKVPTNSNNQFQLLNTG